MDKYKVFEELFRRPKGATLFRYYEHMWQITMWIKSRNFYDGCPLNGKKVHYANSCEYFVSQHIFNILLHLETALNDDIKVADDINNYVQFKATVETFYLYKVQSED